MINKKDQAYEVMTALDKIPGDAAIQIILYRNTGDEQRWEFEVGDIRNMLMNTLFAVPQLLEKIERTQQEAKIEPHLLETSSLSWEYRSTPFNPIINFIGHFNDLGGEGWELIQCDFDSHIAVFKRQKQDEL